MWGQTDKWLCATGCTGLEMPKMENALQWEAAALKVWMGGLITYMCPPQNKRAISTRGLPNGGSATNGTA
jgi:hypothetical protein